MAPKLSQSCPKVVSDVRVANVFSKFVSKRPIGTGGGGGRGIKDGEGAELLVEILRMYNGAVCLLAYKYSMLS